MCALGISGVTFHVRGFEITLTALAVAAIAGILLNAVLPGNDYVFQAEEYENGKNEPTKKSKKSDEKSAEESAK